MLYSGFLMGLVGGLAATAHCLGMCGGFPLHLSRATKAGSLAVRQLLYVLGKTFTYAFLGALFGALGNGLAESGLLPGSQKGLGIVAGTAILLFGLGMVGVKLPSPAAGKLNAPPGPGTGLSSESGWRRYGAWYQSCLSAVANRIRTQEWGFVKSIYSQFFVNPGPGSSFLLGVATGFLPCPITLAMLAVAAGSHSVLQGILILAGLGVGTAPGLLGVGLFGNLVGARWRRVGLKPAGVIVILLGLVTVARTQDFMHRGCHSHAAAKTGAPTCAHCRALGHTCPHCAAKQGK